MGITQPYPRSRKKKMVAFISTMQSLLPLHKRPSPLYFLRMLAAPLTCHVLPVMAAPRSSRRSNTTMSRRRCPVCSSPAPTRTPWTSANQPEDSSTDSDTLVSTPPGVVQEKDACAFLLICLHQEKKLSRFSVVTSDSIASKFVKANQPNFRHKQYSSHLLQSRH